MSKTVWTVAIVALAVVAVLYVTRPKEPKSVAGSTNTLYGSAIAGILALGQSVLAPTREPSLTSSANAADRATADGLPVSATQGNGLMTPSFLDGSSLVSVGEPSLPTGEYIV